jgi:hypothetical protein
MLKFQAEKALLLLGEGAARRAVVTNACSLRRSSEVEIKCSLFPYASAHLVTCLKYKLMVRFEVLTAVRTKVLRF